ncbi:MAG: membrane protein insertase YidC [Trueperaceae bacterium]|nr:membrane protein insertase YidC [Trueperaceae bacterium]
MNLRTLFVTLALLAPAAVHAAEFGVHDHLFSAFQNTDEVTAACEAGDELFFCGLRDATLTRVPTKGVDLFFSPAGEVVGAYAKPRKGQEFGDYSLDHRQNLIPEMAAFPGAAVMLDGAYLEPTEVEGSWTRLNDDTVEGNFRYRAGPLAVQRTMRISNVRHTIDVDVRVERVEEGEEALPVQVTYPGIGNVDDPVIKIGQGLGESGTHATDPLAQPVPDPSYASLQNNDRNTAFAIVLRPAAAGNEDLAAVPMPPDAVAFQTELAQGAGSQARLALTTYLGPNELVRYQQEGYVELPGLFRPNLLGRLSLGILWVLVSIHDVVGNWGLSIIVLTLMFRALVWPLITTQTRSMFGMQELQPKIQELQKKYKDDRETLTQETMKLYKEAGVNPAGGCLPILLQMPLFIILWRVFVNFEFSEGFLWVPDLGQSDPYFILPMLYVAVMFGMSWFSSRGNPQSLRQQILINVVFAFILFGFPAGVLLYFVVSMGTQVFQYWLIQREKAQRKAAQAKG